MTRRKRWLVATLAMCVVVLVGLQLVPVDRHNPPAEVQIDAPPQVMAILKRSCFDCHSNQTHWPWYGKVAPASWLVAHDVHEGRQVLNFSTWNRYTPREQSALIRASVDQVEQGEMPLWFYLPLHGDAKLSEADKATLKAWSDAQR